MPRFLKVTLVIIGAVGFSTLAIQASDLIRGISSSALVIENSGPCDDGSILLQLGSSALCVDQFEVSPSSDCPLTAINRAEDTIENMKDGTCAALSQPDEIPWRYVSLAEAQQLCARSGKRLPDNHEWYQLALTVTDVDSCNIDSDEVTAEAACVNSIGVANIIGNVWEWTNETVFDGHVSGRQLPESGYVSLADANGLVLETEDVPSVTFGDDYAWTSTDGPAGVIRGGFYDSGTDAGLYAQNLSVPLDLRVPGVGFRCVQDVQY